MNESGDSLRFSPILKITLLLTHCGRYAPVRYIMELLQNVHLTVPSECHTTLFTVFSINRVAADSLFPFRDGATQGSNYILTHNNATSHVQNIFPALHQT